MFGADNSKFPLAVSCSGTYNGSVAVGRGESKGKSKLQGVVPTIVANITVCKILKLAYWGSQGFLMLK